MLLLLSFFFFFNLATGRNRARENLRFDLNAFLARFRQAGEQNKNLSCYKSYDEREIYKMKYNFLKF